MLYGVGKGGVTVGAPECYKDRSIVGGGFPGEHDGVRGLAVTTPFHTVTLKARERAHKTVPSYDRDRFLLQPIPPYLKGLFSIFPYIDHEFLCAEDPADMLLEPSSGKVVGRSEMMIYHDRERHHGARNRSTHSAVVPVCPNNKHTP